MNQVAPVTDRFQRALEERAVKKRASTFTVLVVDDEPSILELVKTALETLESYNVSIASDAAAALDEIGRADRPFDCILLDIQMPETDGIELLRGLRTLPDYTDTPILMLTAMSDRKYIDEAFMEGATDYVNKPFDFLELRSRIKCAHQLVDARRKTERSQQCASQLQKKLDRNKQFSFDDPITIQNVDRHLRYIEFDNYVAQLARRKLFGSQGIAVKLQDAELFYDKEGCDGFRRAVQDIARCIQMATHKIDCVFSYRGGGMFLIISHGASESEAIPSEISLNELIGEQLQRQNISDRLNALVGEPVSMRALSRTGATAALQNAVNNVNQLEADLLDDTRADSFDVDEHRSGLRQETRKRVYERVLFELFGSESYLNTR